MGPGSAWLKEAVGVFSIQSGDLIQEASDNASDLTVHVGNTDIDIADYLNTFMPIFYCSDLSSIEGMSLLPIAVNIDPFGDEGFEAINWLGAGVDIEKEIWDGGTPLAIFDWVAERLTSSSVQVVFCDHGMGEVADFIAIEEGAVGPKVSIFHCKGSKEPKAGNRVEDLHDVGLQVNYQSKLSKQFPVPPLRIVYNRAGMHVVAAKITKRRSLIANGLYWASVRTEAEADYLCAILNAPITTELARPFMSYGKDERDIHKAPWELPIPTFDASNTVHARLSELGAAAERIAAAFAINPDLHFAATRRHIRQHVEATPEGPEINDIVYELIS